MPGPQKQLKKGEIRINRDMTWKTPEFGMPGSAKVRAGFQGGVAAAGSAALGGAAMGSVPGAIAGAIGFGIAGAIANIKMREKRYMNRQPKYTLDMNKLNGVAREG